MKRPLKFLGAAALAAAINMSASLVTAQASTVYDWTLSGDNLSGSGTITLGSTASGIDDEGFLATAMTGTFADADMNTSTTTSPANVTGPAIIEGSDNLVYPSLPMPLGGHVLDDFELGFDLSNGFQVLVGPQNSNPGLYNVTVGGPNLPSFSYTDKTITFDLNVAATPLPPTWTMLIAGLAALGFLADRRSRRQLATFAAG
jgi:hypothetical protein